MEKQDIMSVITLKAWETQVERADALLNGLSDEQLLNEIAPGKNRGIYLIGHLIAVHDAMNDILGLSKREHMDLDVAFLRNPDKSGLDMPALPVLKQYWIDVHHKLNAALKKLTPDDWFKKHNLMTDEDFINDPSRNKLNVLMNRTNHLAYHLGQLQLLK